MTERNVTALYLYPLKGAAPVPLDIAQLDSFGIEHDRRWMAVDENGDFLTQREHPLLARISAQIVGDVLQLESTAGMVQVPVEQPLRKRARVSIWQDIVTAVDCGAEAA